ncbi:hypothetical protein D9757_011736 [Collybiopsis confluens]|uniref:Uncharacterized protein n=1 Tax=Collybiopsis confluens TaxID=2823264 RepID=A0A8H5G837_9AGAR|nr:hypothetical protein D9757_011736 [Collybiopsis confluens]
MAMFAFHCVLLALIGLDYKALKKKNFDVLRAWEPVLRGVNEIPCPALCIFSGYVVTDAKSKLSLEENTRHGLPTFELKVSNPRQPPTLIPVPPPPFLCPPFLALTPLDELVACTSIDPPPSLPLPPFPGRVSKLPGSLNSRSLWESASDHVLDLSPFGMQPAKNLEADYKLDQIKAQLYSPSSFGVSFSKAEAEESVLHDQETSSDSDTINSSLLVSWSDLCGPPPPHKVPSPARSPSPAVDLIDAYYHLDQQLRPNYQFASSHLNGLLATLPLSTVSAPSMPGAWRLKSPKTPARRSLVDISLSSAVRLSCPRPPAIIAAHRVILCSPASETSC